MKPCSTCWMREFYSFVVYLQQQNETGVHIQKQINERKLSKLSVDSAESAILNENKDSFQSTGWILDNYFILNSVFANTL